MVSTIGYLWGAFPPGTRDAEARRRVNDVMVDAHRQAVAAIRAAAPGVPVGITLAMTDYQPVEGGASKLEHIRRSMEDVFLAATVGDDFVGVQTYSRERIGPDGRLPAEEGVPELIMGYEYYPQSLAATIRRAWAVTGGEVPLLVTENGIGTDDDNQRVRFIARHLTAVRRAIDEGADVRGYMYWCPMDNFEWTFGFARTFGLIAVDRETFERRPKPSASYYAEICRANAIEPSVTAAYL
jgi:beta-glucosidase